MEINVEKNILLSLHTTLKVGGVADFFVAVNSLEELKTALSFAKEEKLLPLVIGGGSNILASDEGYRGLIIKNCSKGISYTVYRDSVYLSCEAGEIFDEVISDTVSKNYWGLENLSSIPGTVGATPVQNVGAYGVEVSSLITEVSAINIDTQEIKIFSNKECEFSYRNSFFKTPSGKKWVITKIVFKLSMLKNPKLSYGALQDLQVVDNLSIIDVRNAVVKIRSAKFPDWKKVGTAGSFFKNPIISNQKFLELQAKYPEIQGYMVDEDSTKVSLGWILDKVCGLRGFCREGVCLFEEQALVLVNISAQKSRDIENFSNFVFEQVKEKTGIEIEREVTNI